MSTRDWIVIVGAVIVAGTLAIGKFLGMTEIDEDDEEPVIGA